MHEKFSRTSKVKQALCSLFLAHSKSCILGRSSIPLENRLRLEEWNTVVKMDKPRCYLKAFQVEKKSEFDRLVLDATPLNCRSKKAPAMHISTIQSILRDILGFTVAATVDACAYFLPIFQSPKMSSHSSQSPFRKGREALYRGH